MQYFLQQFQASHVHQVFQVFQIPPKEWWEKENCISCALVFQWNSKKGLDYKAQSVIGKPVVYNVNCIPTHIQKGCLFHMGNSLQYVLYAIDKMQE